MKILIAEDDPHTRAGLARILETEGYEVIAAADGDEALEHFRVDKPDLICLDVMMPGRDGLEVCKEIRRDDPEVPILFISARSEEIDAVLALEIGGDDYITKPFGVREVVARIRAVTRRVMARREPTNEVETEQFEIGDLVVVPKQLRALRGEERFDLSLRDVKLLRLFAEHPGRVFDRDTLFSEIWGYDHIPSSRSLDQHISRLRHRIELDPTNPAIIATVHGAGYRYDP